MKDTNSISEGNSAADGDSNYYQNHRPTPPAETATAGNEHEGNGREANNGDEQAAAAAAAELQQQENDSNETEPAGSSISVQTPSERVLIKMSVHNSKVAVRQSQLVEQLSVEDRLPPPTTSGTGHGKNIDSLEKAESDKLSIGKKVSVNAKDVYDEKVWYALGITVAQRLVHLKKLTRISNDDDKVGSKTTNEEWDHVVSGIVDTLRIISIEAEEKQSEIMEVYQDDIKQLLETRMKRKQQGFSSATAAVNETPPHPSDSSFGVFGSAISTVSSLRSVEEEKTNDNSKNDKALDGKLRGEAYVTGASADDGENKKAEKARFVSEKTLRLNLDDAGRTASDDILRLVLYPDSTDPALTADRPNSPLARDASNATNNTASSSTPGAFRVRSMAHGPSTIERATAGDSASREHSYSYTNRSGLAESFVKGQDICVEAVACDDGNDIEEQQVVVIAEEVTIWQQLRQPKILAVIGCLMLIVVAIAVPITMKADTKVPSEGVEMIMEDDDDRDEDKTDSDMPIFACNFTEQYTKLIDKGLGGYGLSISTSGEDAIKWLGDRMSLLNSPNNQFALCEKDVADQSLLQMYSLASIFFSSSPSKRNTLDQAGTKTPFCDKNEGDIGWPSSLEASEDVCQWEGVICGENTTAVVSLDLSRRGWSGTIPDEFIILKESLSYLDLSFNAYSGPLPSTLGLLENLFYLDASANSLTGTIPTALANLTVAYEIYLDNNSWNSTTVPSEVCNLKDAGILTILAIGEGCNCCSSCPSLSLYRPDWI